MSADSATAQTTPNKRSLTLNTLVNMALRLLLVILLISGISYWHLRAQLANDTQHMLLSYITERGQWEESIFVLAEDNHRLLRDDFIEQFEIEQLDIEQFEQAAESDKLAQFRQYFSLWPDGTVRIPAVGTDPATLDTTHNPTAFLQKGVTLTTDLQKRFAIAYELVRRYGAGWRDRFLDTYISFPEGAITILWPGAAWGLDAQTDLDITAEEWAYLGDRAHNPQRESLWTGVFADPVTQDWMVSVETPIDDRSGRHLGTIGHDIVLAELINRVIEDHLEGTTNLLIRDDGQLIAEPELMEEIWAARGKLTVYNADNAHLERIFAMVQDSSRVDDVIYNRADHEYLAIARLDGPDWYLITVYPEKLLQAQVWSNTWFLLGLGLASLILEIGLFWLVLQRQIATPLGDFLAATQQVAAGEFTVKLDTQRPDELGQLATSFTQMTQQLQGAFMDLGQKVAELEKARAASSLLASVVTSSNDAIVTKNLEGIITSWNATAEKMFGYTESEAVGKHITMLFPADRLDEEPEIIKSLKQGQRVEHLETVRLQKDGTPIDISVTISPLKNKAGQVVGASKVVRDIRQRKQSEQAILEKSEALQQALKELQDAQLQLVQNEKMSALGNLVAGVAHEINNPIGFLKNNLRPAQDYIQDLMGLLDLYQTKYPEGDPDIDAEIMAIELDFLRDDLPKLIHSMQNGIERICQISNGLRIFSRKDKEQKVAFNIHDGLDSTLLLLTHRTKANAYRPAIKIQKKYGDFPPIDCFPGQLNQVFMNILANAIDACDEVNRRKTFQEIQANPNIITIQTAVIEAELCIQIKDNGCGMAPDTTDCIFEQGFTTKAVGKGTGLGMAIAHQIITEKHGGSITCSSKLGQGTNFKITLPLL